MTAPAVAPVELDVRIRPAVDTDRNFVLAKWRDSWRLARTNRRLGPSAYNALFDRVVQEGIFAQPDTSVLVACDHGQPDAILGWICYAPGIPTVHFAYVRREVRGLGIFGLLVTAIGVGEGGSLAYTFRPRERTHPQGRDLGMEDALVEAAMRRRIAVRYVEPGAFMGRGRRTA